MDFACHWAREIDFGATRNEKQKGLTSIMARGASTFRQRDVSAAIKATTAAGLPVARVEVDKEGTIVIVAAIADADAAPVSEFERPEHQASLPPRESAT